MPKEMTKFGIGCQAKAGIMFRKQAELCLGMFDD
jgi:hypothetical protein